MQSNDKFKSDSNFQLNRKQRHQIRTRECSLMLMAMTMAMMMMIGAKQNNSNRMFKQKIHFFYSSQKGNIIRENDQIIPRLSMHPECVQFPSN